ncbi:hypothetical protein H4S03_004005 [Coemansia sp. S3946]|nr:hypothetical protein H4S03_004005 [Coemansia sp. S3946]
MSKIGLYTISSGDVAEFRENCVSMDLNYALKNVNLTINPGEKIGIVGRTGAGKSSLAKEAPATLNTEERLRPNGLDKSVQDCFRSFSNGQKQLIGLCRVVLRRRRIIVLDEATANVDLETDKSVQELIRKEFGDCTVLTIAHRLETIMNSDRIIVMDKGTIAEIGTPQELQAKDGMFAQLVKTSDFGQ